jgi:ADP-heptose:LPS heptosyltransferase
LVDELKPFELLDLLSQARSLVAPSTGVLHIAASLGTRVLGIFSPRLVESPVRWGPKGAITHVLVPPLLEREKISADVMSRITVDQIYDALMELESEKIKSPSENVSRA